MRLKSGITGETPVRIRDSSSNDDDDDEEEVDEAVAAPLPPLLPVFFAALLPLPPAKMMAGPEAVSCVPASLKR